MGHNGSEATRGEVDADAVQGIDSGLALAIATTDIAGLDDLLPRSAAIRDAHPRGSLEG
jgi:hypothetical protein